MKSKWILVAISLVTIAVFLSSCSNPQQNVQPYPGNNTTVSSSSITLQWNVDIPQNVSVTYSLYFGNDKNPSLAATGLTQQQYTVKGLRQKIPYYWKVVATDSQGHVVTGPLWQFAFVSDKNTIKGGGTVVEASLGSVQTLDPDFAYDTSSQEAIFQMYDNLLQYERTSTEKIIPMLSTNVPSEENGTILDNGTSYIFHIRKNVYFHNYEKLTPEDVVYSLERAIIFDRNGSLLTESLLPKIDGDYTDSLTAWAVKLGGVKSYSDLFEPGTTTPKNEQAKQALIGAFNLLAKDFEIKGDDVVIHLPSSYSPFLSILTHGMSISAIMDKNWAVENGAWPGTADTWWKYINPSMEKDPLYSIENGTGPFVLDKWSKGNEISFKRFDDYWAGSAKIEYGVVKKQKNIETAMAELAVKKANILLTNYTLTPVKGITETDGFPVFDIVNIFFTWNIKGEQYIGSGKLDGNGIPSDFFSNKDVRLGFEYLFPYSECVKKVFYNKAIVPNGAIPKGMLGYDAATPTPFRQNFSKAEYYFKKAYNGELWEKGFKFSVVFNTGNTHRQGVLNMLRDEAAKLNPKFDINVVSEDWNKFLSDLERKEIPMYVMGWNFDYPDPYDFVYPYYSSNGAYGATLGASYISWAKVNMDPLIERSLEVTDPQKRSQIYVQLNSLAHENALYIWIAQPLTNELQSSSLKGWRYNPANPGVDFYSLYY